MMLLGSLSEEEVFIRSSRGGKLFSHDRELDSGGLWVEGVNFLEKGIKRLSEVLKWSYILIGVVGT